MRTIYNNDVYDNNDGNNAREHKYNDFKNINIMILKDINMIVL